MVAELMGAGEEGEEGPMVNPVIANNFQMKLFSCYFSLEEVLNFKFLQILPINDFEIPFSIYVQMKLFKCYQLHEKLIRYWLSGDPNPWNSAEESPQE